LEPIRFFFDIIDVQICHYYDTISGDNIKRKLRRIEDQQLEEEINDAKPI